jgi:hypothetical protein
VWFCRRASQNPHPHPHPTQTRTGSHPCAPPPPPTHTHTASRTLTHAHTRTHAGADKNTHSKRGCIHWALQSERSSSYMAGLLKFTISTLTIVKEYLLNGPYAIRIAGTSYALIPSLLTLSFMPVIHLICLTLPCKRITDLSIHLPIPLISLLRLSFPANWIYRYVHITHTLWYQALQIALYTPNYSKQSHAAVRSWSIGQAMTSQRPAIHLIKLRGPGGSSTQHTNRLQHE